MDFWLLTVKAPDSGSLYDHTFGLGQCLERLCLATPASSSTYWSDALGNLLLDRPRNWRKQDALKVLTLHGLRLTSQLCGALALIVPFANLAQLILWECEGTHSLLKDITSNLPLMGSKLTLLAIGINPESEPHIDEPLGTLLEACKNLTSLCLQWDDQCEYKPRPFLGDIEKFGRTLRLLSLHAISRDESLAVGVDFRDISRDEDDLKKISRRCPGLENLGYRIAEEDLMSILKDIICAEGEDGLAEHCILSTCRLNSRCCSKSLTSDTALSLSNFLY